MNEPKPSMHASADKLHEVARKGLDWAGKEYDDADAFGVPKALRLIAAGVTVAACTYALGIAKALGAP